MLTRFVDSVLRDDEGAALEKLNVVLLINLGHVGCLRPVCTYSALCSENLIIAIIFDGESRAWEVFALKPDRWDMRAWAWIGRCHEGVHRRRHVEKKQRVMIDSGRCAMGLIERCKEEVFGGCGEGL